jgi:putative drug exporter of the RND superfamily
MNAHLGALEFKQLGVGLAVAILIDVTVVRAVLLPATMKLLGEWNCTCPAGWTGFRTGQFPRAVQFPRFSRRIE